MASNSHAATGEAYSATHSPVLSYRNKPKNILRYKRKSPKCLGNRSDCIELAEKRESSEVEGVVDSSKNIFKRRFSSQPTTNNMFKKDVI